MFQSEYVNGRLSLEQMTRILRDQGFTIIGFNHIYNDEDVFAIITELKLSNMTDKSKCFTYVDRNYRLVFLHEDLTKEEKLLVLAHEEGHIFCDHFSHSPIIGKNVAEEYEANEFAHYVLNPSILLRIASLIMGHVRITTVILIMLVLFIVGSVGITHIIKEKSYYGEYYVTISGNKYHEKDCIFIKNKNNVRRMTIDEFKSGMYEACRVCLP